MKLVADGAALAEAARFVNGVVPGKPHEAELGGMLIDVRDWSDGQVTASFACYDYYTSGSSVIETTGSEPGKVLVSARLLTDVLANAAKRGEVTLADQPGDQPGRPGWLVISCRGAEWKLPLLGVDLYPELPGLAEPVGRIDPFDLVAGLERVLVAAGEPEDPPMLGGVCLHSEGETLTLATTDRYRVAVTQIPWTPETGGDGLRTLPDTLIPVEVLSTALTVARRTVPSKKDAREPDIDKTIRLHLGAHGVALVGPTHVVTGRVIDGQRGAASAWRKIAWAIKEPSTLVTVRTAELRQAVRDVSLVLDPKEAIVCEFFDHGGITLSPTVEGKGRVVVSLDAVSTTGPSYEAQVESRFLLDVLGAMKSEFTSFSFLARPFVPFQVNPDHADGTLDQTYWQVIAQKRGAAAVGAP